MMEPLHRWARSIVISPLVFVVLLTLSACADFQPQAAYPALPCPPLVAYTAAELDRLSEEVDRLPERSIIARMILDYRTMRKLCSHGS